MASSLEWPSAIRCDIALGARVSAKPSDGDDVECAVGCPVAATVEAMARCLAGRGWDRAHAAECSEACFGMQALGVVAGGEEELRGGRVTDKFRVTRAGASSSTMAAIMASRSAISS